MAAATLSGVAKLDLDVAGAEPISSAALLQECARAAGRRAVVFGVRSGILLAAVGAVERVGLHSPVARDQLARSLEDKTGDIVALKSVLGIEPAGFAAGLRRAVSRDWAGPLF